MWKSNFKMVWDGVKTNNKVPEDMKLWFHNIMNHFVHCRGSMGRGKYRRRKFELLLASYPHAFCENMFEMDEWLKTYSIVDNDIFLYGIPKICDTMPSLGEYVNGISEWFYEQYAFYKTKSGTMTPRDPRRVLWEKLVDKYKNDFMYIEDYSKLNSKRALKWNSMFMQLQLVLNKEVPSVGDEDELYYWLIYQKREYRLKIGGMKEGSLRRKLWDMNGVAELVKDIFFI